ncbi:MAG: hypothetical protein LBJ62_04670 [Bifidobacteriaceae bacterium]|jgi:hypothetical protein|nr:hypothetical protein [Bifidobacteriaceae bacterium]
MAGTIWLDWPPGVKVTIRRRLPDGGYADTVGTLEEADLDHVAVRHRSGELRLIAASDIAIAHLVPDGRS